MIPVFLTSLKIVSYERYSTIQRTLGGKNEVKVDISRTTRLRI